MRRFMLTLNVIDLIKYIFGFLVLVFFVYLLFQFGTGSWTIEGMIDGMNDVASNCMTYVSAFFISVWNHNKKALGSIFVVCMFVGCLFLFLDADS